MDKKPIIDTNLILGPTKTDIGATGWEAFEGYRDRLRTDPELEQKHKKLVDEYKKRKA